MQMAQAVLICFTCLLTASLYFPSAHADDEGKARLFNDLSCGKYIEHRSEPKGTGNNAADAFYIAGWLAAYNYYTPNTCDILADRDLESGILWLDQYCRNNPLSTLQVGLIRLARSLHAHRMQHCGVINH